VCLTEQAEPAFFHKALTLFQQALNQKQDLLFPKEVKDTTIVSPDKTKDLKEEEVKADEVVIRVTFQPLKDLAKVAEEFEEAMKKEKTAGCSLSFGMLKQTIEPLVKESISCTLCDKIIVDPV